MKTANPALVLDTLRFLGKQLKLNQLRLRYQKRERRKLQSDEATTRRTLKQIKDRVKREIDAHPDIAQGFRNSGDGI